MAKARPVRQKHVPQRTCVVCRAVRAKRELVRVVRTPEGDVVVDEKGKRSGRGAYLCRRRSCWTQALQRHSLERALSVELSPEAQETLQTYIAGLPEQEEPGTGD